MANKSHATEIMQKTRIELENGDISKKEQDEAIRVSIRKIVDSIRIQSHILPFFAINM
jgi:hypothetical protein